MEMLQTTGSAAIGGMSAKARKHADTVITQTRRIVRSHSSVSEFNHDQPSFEVCMQFLAFTTPKTRRHNWDILCLPWARPQKIKIFLLGLRQSSACLMNAKEPYTPLEAIKRAGRMPIRWSATPHSIMRAVPVEPWRSRKIRRWGTGILGWKTPRPSGVFSFECLFLMRLRGLVARLRTERYRRNGFSWQAGIRGRRTAHLPTYQTVCGELWLQILARTVPMQGRTIPSSSNMQ